MLLHASDATAGHMHASDATLGLSQSHVHLNLEEFCVCIRTQIDVRITRAVRHCHTHSKASCYEVRYETKRLNSLECMVTVTALGVQFTAP